MAFSFLLCLQKKEICQIWDKKKGDAQKEREVQVCRAPLTLCGSTSS